MVSLARRRPTNNWMKKALSEVENLMQQLFHSPLLDMRLAIANSAQGASLAIYHLVSNVG